MRHLDVAPELAKITPADAKAGKQGVFTFIARSPDLQIILEKEFGRPNLCLKVFKDKLEPLDKFCWSQGSLLAECTRVQNLFALEGFAPRVYEIVLVNGQNWAQVTDYVETEGEPDRPAVAEMMARRKLSAVVNSNPKNWVGKWLVDFQAFAFIQPEAYEKSLVSQAYEVAAWGSRDEPYQAIGELQTEGQRDFGHRAIAMRLDEIDFTGKTVLDLGCNLGVFCHEVYARGAKRAVGVDLPHVTELASELANWLGYWNLDFFGLHLPAGKDQIAPLSKIDQFDVVLALSVDRQVGYAPWMAGLVAEGGTFYLEGHVAQHEVTFRARLEEDFIEVECLGATRDHGPRPLFRCRK